LLDKTYVKKPFFSLSLRFNISFFVDSSINDEKKKAYWERECLCIVRERTTLQRTEEELSMAKRGLTLENERARAENEYRQLIYLSGISNIRILVQLNEYFSFQ
jgi:hypothetical protein